MCVCHERRTNKNKKRNDDVVADDDETVLLEHVHDNGDNDQDNTNECTDDADEQYQITTERIVDTADVEQNSHFENNANNVPNTDNELFEHIKQSSIIENQTENENVNENADQNDSNEIELLLTQPTTTDNELTYDKNNSMTTLGNDVLQKQWHRRLRTPIWARSSIQIIIFSILFFQKKKKKKVSNTLILSLIHYYYTIFNLFLVLNHSNQA